MRWRKLERSSRKKAMKKSTYKMGELRLPTVGVAPQDTSAATAPAPLTFPQALLRTPPSQLDMAQDEVTKVVEQLDERARHFGTTLGISMPNFDLNDVANEVSQSEGWIVLAVALTRSPECVSLEKRDGRWGLWYTKVPPVLASSQRPVASVPLRDAPLEARMKFLRKSEEFFREYLKRAEEGLGSPQQAADIGKQTLAMLDRIKPR